MHTERAGPYVFPNSIVTGTGVKRVRNQPCGTGHTICIFPIQCTENVPSFIFIVIGKLLLLVVAMRLISCVGFYIFLKFDLKLRLHISY